MRRRPYGNYKGGAQRYVEGSRIQGAFIAENKFVRTETRGNIMREDEDVNEQTPVERFLIAVPHPQPKQKQGPRLLPIRMHDRDWARQRKERDFKREQEEEQKLVLDLGGLE
jgi:hypothetical protein